MHTTEHLASGHALIGVKLVLAIRSELYPSQTKILEVRTNLSEYVVEALFTGVSTRFGLRIVEKSVENRDFILHKRRFWKDERTKDKFGFSTDFSMVRSKIE
jgi:hypothetical protein